MVAAIIKRQVSGVDEYGNPVSSGQTTETIIVEDKDFQNFTRQFYSSNILQTTSTGTFQKEYKKLFLRDTLKDKPVTYTDKIEVSGKEYSVTEIAKFSKHTEIVLVG